MIDVTDVLAELKQREPIFHHPDRYGRSKEAIQSMMVEDFWEVGASGQIYDRDDVIRILLKRYADSAYEDNWEACNFKCRRIAEDNYLLTYDLTQEKTRNTRRVTLWRKVNNNCLIVYHQGTIISG